ncbi:23S rRNA (adenine(2503)-C(2))-methyltransferase RlmN [Enterococcus hirae]|nr:23S rRNA (adenine(2503)-C(2))-methyltransferase RlmN [Enterococcus hirae]
MKPSIYGMTKEDLITWLAERGEKKFRATQIWDWLYIKRVASFAEMTNLKKELAAMLEENFVLETLKPLVVQEASDGTTKYLFELEDKNLIETVLMRQEYGLSLCVTTQLGCNMGCSFCASGLLKKSRDLTAGEITAQVMEVQRFLDKKEERLSHVVVMGIGEPFDNYENVMKFVRIINDQKGLAIGARHITVSTCGVVPKIREFAREGLQVNLALSLHAPNEELRSRLMKVNRTFTLAKIMDAIDDYLDQTDRRVTFEYIMLHGVNDQIAQARELAELLQDHKKLAYVNLIPYNPVSEHDQYQRSEQQDVLRFYDYLKKHGINCVIRQEHGTDIDAACGQLRSKQLGVL